MMLVNIQHQERFPRMTGTGPPIRNDKGFTLFPLARWGQPRLAAEYLPPVRL